MMGKISKQKNCVTVTVECIRLAFVHVVENGVAKKYFQSICHGGSFFFRYNA